MDIIDIVGILVICFCILDIICITKTKKLLKQINTKEGQVEFEKLNTKSMYLNVLIVILGIIYTISK